MFIDLRDFIQKLRDRNDVEDIFEADPNLEIGTITELKAERRGKALLFDKIKGYPDGFRIVSNLLTTPKRMALALGYEKLRPIDVVRALKERLKDYSGIKPVEVNEAPFLENSMKSENVNLFKLPAPKWHEKDGGQYLGTGCCVIQRDPENDWINIASYRVQIHERNIAGLEIAHAHHGELILERYRKMGKSCPVAVVCGQSPEIFLASTYPCGWGVSEYDFAGWFCNEPIKVVRGPITNLPIPASAEVVIEGEIPTGPNDFRDEGPFGEFPGYYVRGKSPQPIINVKSIFFRNDPIIQGNPPMRLPLSHFGIPWQSAPEVWNQLEKAGIPEIRGVWDWGDSRFLIIISLKQKYAGHAKQAGLVACGLPVVRSNRLVIIVDDDIDPSNLDQVVWAVITRCDPATAIDVVRNCFSHSIDPLLSPDRMKRGDTTNTRAIIEAVRPFDWRDKFPPVNVASEELRNKILSRWKNIFQDI